MNNSSSQELFWDSLRTTVSQKKTRPLELSGIEIKLEWLSDNYKAINIEGKFKVSGQDIDVSRRVYQRKIDFDFKPKSEEAAGMTNRELMKKGRAPYVIDNDGTESIVELHHLIQKEPGTMVEISESVHDSYSKALHGLVDDGGSFRNSSIKNKQYNNFRSNYWKLRALG